MTEPTPDQLAEWRRLAEAATRGPWRYPVRGSSPATTKATAPGRPPARGADTGDVAAAVLSAVETIKETGGAVEIHGVRIERCDEYGVTETVRTADRLAARVAEVERERDEALRGLDAYISANAASMDRAKAAESEVAYLRLDRAELADQNEALRTRIDRSPDHAAELAALRERTPEPIRRVLDDHEPLTMPDAGWVCGGCEWEDPERELAPAGRDRHRAHVEAEIRTALEEAGEDRG